MRKQAKNRRFFGAIFLGEQLVGANFYAFCNYDDTYCNVESWYWWSDNGGNWGLSALLGLHSSVLATNSNIQQQALLANKQTNKHENKQTNMKNKQKNKLK